MRMIIRELVAALFFYQAFGVVPNLLTALVEKFKHPLTILDIDDTEIDAADYLSRTNHVLVIFSASPYKIEKLSTISNKSQLTIFNTNFSDTILEKLSLCEHFDIVFVGRKFFSEPERLLYIMSALRKMSQYIIITCDGPISQATIRALQPIIIREFKDGLEVIIEGDAQRLQQRNIFWPLGETGKDYTIISNFDSKYLVKTGDALDRIKTDWKPGINLLTFIAFGGIRPTYSEILQQLKMLAKIKHSDWRASNIVVSGATLSMIDFEETRDNFTSEEAVNAQIELTLFMLKCATFEQRMEAYIKNCLLPCFRSEKIYLGHKSIYVQENMPSVQTIISKLSSLTSV